MKKKYLRWKKWSHYEEDGVCVLNDDAPEEAKESYKHYLKQEEKAQKEIEAGISMD